MPAPEPGPPFSEIEVPERMVDTGCLPIEDSRESFLDNEQLVLMNVAMHKDMPMAGAGFEELSPSRELVVMSEAVGGLLCRPSAGLGVERSAEPAHFRTVVV